MFRICGGAAAVLLLIVLQPILGYCAPSPSAKEFVVFDGLLYTDKPNLGAFGMHPIIQMNPPQGLADQVDEAKTRATMEGIKDFSGLVFLDYEVWPLSGASKEVIESNIAKYNRVAEIAHETVPNATFGYYGLMPCREYWGLVNNNRKKIEEWKECNRQGEAVASHVEVIFPSLYTFYNNQNSWDIYAKGMIEEARRYKKPVYVFLWPEFHVSNVLLRGTNIPAKFWRHQLELCRSLSDGIVIWGGWKENWKADADWWLETKAFMASVNSR